LVLSLEREELKDDMASTNFSTKCFSQIYLN
jgi:hypothetical protein